MPVEIEWDNEEKTILRMRMIGHWTWDEVYPASREGYDMLESVQHVVDAIIDLRESKCIPRDGILHAKAMIGKRHPRIGLTVFVGANLLFIRLWNLFKQVYALFAREQEFTFAETLNDAYSLLAALRARSDSQ